MTAGTHDGGRARRHTHIAWRYAEETVALLAARAPGLRKAIRDAARAGHSCVVLDGTLIPVDRVAADRSFYSGKRKKHGMNLQVIARPRGDILWVSGRGTRAARRGRRADGQPGGYVNETVLATSGRKVVDNVTGERQEPRRDWTLQRLPVRYQQSEEISMNRSSKTATAVDDPISARRAPRGTGSSKP